MTASYPTYGPSVASFGPSLVPSLRRQLRDRLAALELERRSIICALDLLDGEGPRSAPRRRRDRTLVRERILDAVQAEPGIRASVVAIACGRAPSDVMAELQEMLRAGLVERSGVGWRPT